jgi:hypothetical protein
VQNSACGDQPLSRSRGILWAEHSDQGHRSSPKMVYSPLWKTVTNESPVMYVRIHDVPAGNPGSRISLDQIAEVFRQSKGFGVETFLSS